MPGGRPARASRALAFGGARCTLPFMDPSVARFLARHAKPAREAVEADAARYRDLTPDERGRELEAACRTAARLLEGRPDREQVRARRDPPHPSYFAIIRRLRERRP